MTSTLFHTRHHTFFTSLVLFTWACSVVVLSLMAYEVDTVGNVDGFFAFTLFNTAFSMLMLGGLLALAHIVPTFFLLQSRFVLGLITLLWLFWTIAAAGDTHKLSKFLDLCGNFRFARIATDKLCSGARGIIAFSWIAWVALTVMFFGSSFATTLEHRRGHHDVWSTSAFEYPFGQSASAGFKNEANTAQPQMSTVHPTVEEPRTIPTTAV